MRRFEEEEKGLFSLSRVRLNNANKNTRKIDARTVRKRAASRRERRLATFDDDARRNSSILENACITMTTTLFALCKEDANDDDAHAEKNRISFPLLF